MKAKIRDFISIIIFLVLIFSAVLLVRPAYINLLSRISEYTQGAISFVEEKTSLKLSYKSLSPSILSAFYVKDIKLSDEAGKTVVKIDKVKLEYKLLNMLRGNLSESFSSLVADGVEVDVDAGLPIIQSIASGGSGVGNNNGFDFSSFKAQIPFNVTVKNVSIAYRKGNFDANATIKKLTAEYVARKKQLSVDLSSFAKVTVNKKSYTGNIGVSGDLFDGLENSTALLTLSNLTDGNARFNKLNLHLNYENNILTWTTIQNTFPLRFVAVYDTVSKNADVNFVANDFSIESIFASSGRNPIVQKMKNFKFTSDSTLSYKVFDNKLSYKSNSSVQLPSSILPGGGALSFLASGDEKQINIHSLSLKGDNYDVTSNLNFAYKNFELSGLLDVPRVVLPNGAVVSAEVYFDPLKKGFMAFIPQIFIDEKAFTALELSVIPNADSVDFSFVGYDYSHFETEEPGLVSVDGSYLFSSNYIQASVSANSLYVDSVADTVAIFLKPEQKQNVLSISPSFTDFMFSGDAYISTDLSSLSYNIPYIMLANTKKDNQFLMLSLDGNEQSVSVSQADLILGKQAFRASASVDKMSATKNDFFFSADMTTESIPYHLAGTITDGLLRVSGDYDMEVEVGYSKKQNVSGYVQFSGFPIPVFGTSIVSTVDAVFSYSKENGPEINFKKIEVDEAGNKFRSNPHIAVSGNATKYGAQFNSITYTDLYSVLDGNADIVVDAIDGLFNFGSMTLNLKNPLSEEKVTLASSISNPDQKKFDLDSLIKDFYFDSSVSVNRLSLNRFTRLNSANNEITASVFFMGTIEHPSVSVDVDSASVMLSGNALTASANIFMEDKDISISELNINYRDIKTNNVSGLFSFESFSGDFTANIDAVVMEESVYVPLKFEIRDAIKENSKLLPSAFTVVVSSDSIYGSFMKKDVAFSISAMFSPNMISVISSENIGLFGYYNKSGEFSFMLDSKDIAQCKLTGIIEEGTQKIEGKIFDISARLENIFSYFNLRDFFEVYDGTLTGSIYFKGTSDNPEFTGSVLVSNPNIAIPVAIPECLFTDEIMFTFLNNEIDVPEKIIKVRKGGEAKASCKIYLDKWRLEHIDAWITADKKAVPISIKSNGFSLSGDANGELGIYFAGKDMELTGKVFAEKAEVFVNLAKVSTLSNTSSNPVFYTFCDLDVALGTHVRLTVDPLIRCVFVPNGALQVQYDQRTNQVVLDGNLGIRTGDVSYLKRNFYIKDGTIKFVRTEDFLNPRISVRAETRERDDKGDNVTIILEAENQQLMSFSPRFSSIPAKSENEIQVLLGQIAVADSGDIGNFLFAAGDYALQSTIGRKVENSLRNWLNFDIVSIRNNIIQNALIFTSNSDNTAGNVNFGNFLDNSTVYIGKYLGSAFYVDAMVHLQYDANKIGENDRWVNGFALQPEFGFEIASPFANTLWNNNVLWNFNFRLNVAPDINAMIQSQQFVPSTSLSLSWKFSF